MYFLIWALIQVLNKQTYLETKKDISKQREISYTVVGVVKVELEDFVSLFMNIFLVQGTLEI